MEYIHLFVCYIYKSVRTTFRQTSVPSMYAVTRNCAQLSAYIGLSGHVRGGHRHVGYGDGTPQQCPRIFKPISMFSNQ